MLSTRQQFVPAGASRSRVRNGLRGKMHGDRRALTDDALGADRSAMRLDEVSHDGEAEAGPSFFARASRVDPIEALEDAAEVLGRDSAPRVTDAKRRAAARRCLGAHGHAAALRV